MSSSDANLQMLDIVSGSPMGFPYYSRDINIDSSVFGDGTYVYYSLSSFSVGSSSSDNVNSSGVSVTDTYGDNPFVVSGDDFTPIASNGLYNIVFKLSVDYPGILPTGVTHVSITDGSDTFAVQSITPNAFSKSYMISVVIRVSSSTPIQFNIDNQCTGSIDVLNTSKIYITRLG